MDLEDITELLIKVLVFLIPICWVVWEFDLNPFSNEITVYTQYYECKDKERSGCSWENLEYQTYRVNPETQSVIYWNSGATWPLNKLSDCIVVSKKQWSCGNKYYYLGFDNGKFSGKDTETLKHVLKTEWWWKKLH